MNYFKRIFLLSGLLIAPFLLQQCCREEHRDYTLANLFPRLVDSFSFASQPQGNSMDFGSHAFRVQHQMRYASLHHYGGASLMALTLNCPTYYRSLAAVNSLNIKAGSSVFSGVQPGDSLQQFCEFRLLEDQITKGPADEHWGSLEDLLRNLNARMRSGATTASSTGQPRLDFVFRFKQKPLPGWQSIYLEANLSNGETVTGDTYEFQLQ
jgi:hypothetical protein